MNSDTLILRHINPIYVFPEHISLDAFIGSQNFVALPKDAGKLSAYNGDKYTPEKSYEHFTGLGFKSVGVMAVTVAECKTIPVECIEDNDPFDGHSFVDFRESSNNESKKIAKKIKRFAVERNWCYNPNIDSENWVADEAID